MSSPETEKGSKWLGIAAAVILSPASLLTAWSSFQASQWSRAQALAGNAVVAELPASYRRKPAHYSKKRERRLKMLPTTHEMLAHVRSATCMFRPVPFVCRLDSIDNEIGE
jgi:hypothetical protein